MTMTEQGEPEHGGGTAGTHRAESPSKPSPVPRARPAADDDDSRRTSVQRPGKPQRGATVLACLAAAAVLLAAAAVWFALEANRLREGAPEENAAVVDAERTAEVRKQISSAVESLFSYNYASLERTRRAAERVLLDEPMRDYSAKLSAASKEVKQRKLVRTTSVRAIGVRELRGDTARVLIFLDQQTLAADDKRSSSTRYLEVVARKVGGSWKIAKMSGG